MGKGLTQPKVNHYCHWLEINDHFGVHGNIYDDKSNELLDELFSLLEQVSPISDNGARSLWLRAERGPIEDFGNMEEEIACGNYKSEDEFVSEWKGWFPDEVEWYQLSAVELKEEGYRAVTIRHKFVIVQDQSQEPDGFVNEISEFVQWMVDGVKECIEMLRNGTYNDFIKDNLPPWHRTGTIVRKNFWDIWPSEREAFFKDISQEDVAEFINLASSQNENYETLPGRLKSMTANDYFRYCALGYAENHYKGYDKTPREQYYLHADGRDDDLGALDPDDPEAFHAWLHDRTKYGGHPWEVCRGGNSTHVSLNVMDDSQGYYLHLAGSAWNRTVETVKFYLALTRAGIPVYLDEAHALAERMAETEKIGIVPDGVMPAYCERYFPTEHIIDFMNLPYEDREKFLPFCTWYEEDQISLLSGKEGDSK